MEDLIIKDFETSVQNSAEAEELFGDTTDDIIAVANQHGFIEKIPILGWVVKTFPMTDEILCRHLLQENADLKSGNSRLRMLADTQENKIQEKDKEILCQVNQIASDMIHKSDYM